MTTAASPAQPTRASSVLGYTPLTRSGRPPRISFARSLSSESTKLLTLPSTWVLAAVALVLSAGAAALVAATEARDGGAAIVDTAASTARVVGSVSTVGELIVAILAVLLVTGEYASGQMRTTLASDPSRLRVLASKSIVAAAAAVVLSIVTALGALAAGAAVFASRGVEATIGVELAQTVGGTTLFWVFLAVVCVMIATIVRNAAAGISLVFALLFVVPVAFAFIGDGSATSYLLPYADQIMGKLVAGVEPMADLGRDIAVLAGWLVLPTVGAIALLTRRDV
ncbi:ABC transporter permease [Frigoribacterium sp. 2-23]|uniref:ABC transporter permease n=1 Tax=Frigoribacterium sp. 2-23 TaxID=3415006 RepID=UPI003C703FA7